MFKGTKISRRRAVQTLGFGTAGLSSMAVFGCGDDDDDAPPSGTSTPASGSPSESPKRGGTLRVGTLQDVFNLNPFSTAAGRDHHYLYQIYDALFAYTPDDLSPQPNLATSFEVPSETSIILKIDPQVQFHDGSTLSAQLVADNIKAVIDPANKSVQAGLLKPISSVSVTGTDTVTLKLSNPSAALIDFLSYNPGLMQAKTTLEGRAETDPIGAGPFALQSRVQNDLTKLSKFASYHDSDFPYLDGVELKVLSDGTTRVNALRSGEIDLAIVVPLQSVQQLESDSNISIVKGNTLVHHLFYVQSQKPPFNDVRLRQAVSLGIDRQDVVEKVMFGFGQPAQGTMTPVQPAFDSAADFTRHDPAGAQARLEAAGRGEGFEFEVVTQAVSPFKESVEAMQAQLARIGIKMNINFLESAEFTQRLVKGEIEALYSQWAGAADPDFTFTNRYAPEGGYNANRHDFPEVNERIKKARETYDTEERIRLYREADKFINGSDEGQMALDIIVAYPEEAFGFRNNVQGFDFFGDGKLRCKSIWLS